MNRKKILIIVAVIVVAVIAYFVMFKKSTATQIVQPDAIRDSEGNITPGTYTGPTEISPEGVVTRSNLGVPVGAPAATPIVRSSNGRPVITR